ncbi:hypothetical protein OXYTRIMIC_808 [Oxytricha trifallax]|uniref:Uncharacterized protein n=1 Tax=Oxytricha trifallax TaxID=1172189 RepID=A0A073IB68_9SPIT|nr:hypothetical protein OXYTRIMIC_808 [Oxytricha trifallax]
MLSPDNRKSNDIKPFISSQTPELDMQQLSPKMQAYFAPTHTLDAAIFEARLRCLLDNMTVGERSKKEIHDVVATIFGDNVTTHHREIVEHSIEMRAAVRKLTFPTEHLHNDTTQQGRHARGQRWGPYGNLKVEDDICNHQNHLRCEPRSYYQRSVGDDALSQAWWRMWRSPTWALIVGCFVSRSEQEIEQPVRTNRKKKEISNKLPTQTQITVRKPISAPEEISEIDGHSTTGDVCEGVQRPKASLGVLSNDPVHAYSC